MGGNPCAQVAEVGRTSWRRVAGSISAAESRLNRTVADSAVGRYFKLEARKSTFTREIRAGTAIFLTMAYIISVNTSILTDSGGPCTLADCNPKGGPDCKSIANPGYRACLAEVKNDLTVATILPAVAGSLLMGSLANLPFALAPGMGTNAFFTFNMVGFHGTGTVPYGTALGAIMVEGCLFLALSVLGLRSRLARIIPRSIRLASAVGIGMFLAFSGLQGHQGIGMVGPSPSTLVTLTACADVDPVTGACIAGGRLSSATFWLGVVGFLITAVCLAKDIKGSMVYGIIFVTLVSWIRNTSVTFFPNTDAGDASFNFFKKVVSFHVIKRTAGAISFTGFNRSEVWVALVTLLYVDVLDTTGGMYSMAEYGGFTADDDKGGFEGEYRAFMVDAGSTIMSSALGSTTVTTFVESTAGMREGGRTGITAIVVAVYFALSLFFTPLLASVPPWAVGPSLVIVGMMMMKLVTEIEWAKVEEGVPAFLTMVLMPLTFSISNGIIAGLGVHIAMHVGDYLVGMVRWVRKTKKMVEASQNQVSAANADATV